MSANLFVAVAATSVAGVAIGALIVIVLRPADPPPPPPPQRGPPEGSQQQAPPQWRQPASRTQGMPMQAMSRPMNTMGGPGPQQHAAPAAFAPYGAPQPVAGTPLPAAQQRETEQIQRLRGQFEAEFENTVPSMEDLVRVREENETADLNVSPSDVLDMLSAGNVRFWTGQSSRPELNAMQRRAEIWQSYPKVAIIGCSDSRVPIEIVFDVALGDVFSIRVAGNAYGTGVAGSILYAVTHLHVKVVMVFGHEGCGIIRTAQQPLDKLESGPEELASWFKLVRRGVGLELGSIADISDTHARDREAVIRNVIYQVRLIRSKVHIARRVATGELLVVGAFYEKRSGMVDFIRVENDVSPHMQPRGNRGLQQQEPDIQIPG